MNMIALDSIKIARRLKQTGLTDAQAEAIAEVQAETFNTRLDHLVTSDHLDMKIQEVRTEIQEVRTEIQEVRVDLVRWMAGLLMAQTGLLFALIKLIG